MPRYRYSIRESWNRILEAFQGNPEPSNVPFEMTGEILSEQEALSDLALLLVGQLPNQNFNLPLLDVDKYGGIWTWTGTSTITGLVADVYTKITGSFQHESDHYFGVTPQSASDRIYVNDVGMYFVSWQVSYLGSPDIEYAVEPYWNVVGLPEAVARTKPSASGTSISMSGTAFVYVSGTSYFDLRVSPDTSSAWFIPKALQLNIQRVRKS